MNIGEYDLKLLIRQTFFRGMEYGYGVDHTKKSEDEEKFWIEYSESLELFKPKRKVKSNKSNLLNKVETEGYILVDTENGGGFYRGKMYVYQGCRYPCYTSLKEEAKVYKSEKVAKNVAERLEDNGWTDFKVRKLK